MVNNIWPLPPWDFPGYEEQGWLLDEDRALRDLMKGMVVTDQENRQRNVDAWFGHPDKELRAQDYPYVTIDLLQIQEDTGRTQRGDLYIKEVPKWWGLKPLENWQVGYLLEMPHPVDLDYQISTWARNPRHDRQILFQMITGGRTMLRNGLLYTADGKIRRLDLLAHTKRDTVEEGGKRLFNNIFRVRISSEVPWGVINGRDYGVGEVRDIRMQIRSYLGRYQTSMDKIRIRDAFVTHFSNGKADLDVAGQPATGVPVLRSVPALRQGDTVAISMEEKVPSPAGLDDYRLLVLAREKAVEPQVEHWKS